MKKSKQYILILTGGVLLLFISIWLILYGLVAMNKDTIHRMVVKQINKQVKGNVWIGDISTQYFRTFPYLSFSLSDVVIQDSLWDEHHHDLLNADKIYIRLSMLSLLTGKPQLSKIIVEGGQIYLFKDECGYLNLNRPAPLSFNKGETKIPDFKFIQTRLTIENHSLNSFHDIDFRYLNCAIVKKDSALILNISIQSLVHRIGFNLEKGSYLKEKKMEGKFKLGYYPNNRIELQDVSIKIDAHPFTLDGAIALAADTMSYDLHIQTKKLNYQTALHLFTESLYHTFEKANIMQPFDIEATIAGRMARKVIPHITTHFSVIDSEMKTPVGTLTHCTYKGNFTNQVDSLNRPGDENSRFIFHDFTATWSSIPFFSRRMEITNLTMPFLNCDLRSEFSLADLNNLEGSSTLQFIKGTGILNIKYAGSVSQNDTILPILNGNISIKDGEIKYMPRNLDFSECNGQLIFLNQDVDIKHLSAKAGSTTLVMDGHATNLLALLNLNPEKLIIEWNIFTPELNLKDFISFLGESKELPETISPKENRIKKIGNNLDRMLRNGTTQLNLRAEKMKYKKFNATGVTASVVMQGNNMVFNDVRLKHADGLLRMKGSMINKQQSNLISITSDIENVNIPDLFYAFDNFGQDAVTSKNMKGRLSAKIEMAGELSSNAEVTENSIKSHIDFVIDHGELIHFEPAEKIAATAFKNRDFSQIQFAQLKNRLDIAGSAITIHKMEIRSNVIILFAEGIYDTKKGTDMSIQVPLSNLSKAENDILENTGRAGMNIRLRAKTGEDGQLKVSWDPFNNAATKRKKENKVESLRN